MNRFLLITIMGMLTASPFIRVETCRAEEAIEADGPRVPYDSELYGLSYEVFLANNNPADAFRLAEKAVQARPADSGWRRKAAQSAEWSGNSARALEHWYFLAVETGQKDALEHAFRLARAMGDGSRLKRLLELRGFAGDSALLREYVAACETTGAPDDAIAVLERHRLGTERKYALQELARLYEAVGRNNDAIAARLETAAGFGINGTQLLKAAGLAYGSGDIQASYTILSMGRHLPAPEQEFWKTYGDLCWAMQDTRTAAKASQMLLESGAAREVDFQRLIQTHREKQPDQAYGHALAAWRRFGKGEYLISLLEIGIGRKRYAELAAVIGEAEKSGALKTIDDAANYWTYAAQVQRGIGNIEAGMRCYQKALKLAPSDGALAAGYIWWLLDMDRRVDLRMTLQAWKGRESNLPELIEPFGAAYAYLGENSRALAYFQSLYAQKRNDPSWLAAYADTIEQAGWPEAAFVERLRALSLARKRMKAENMAGVEDRRSLQTDYIRLAASLSPGDSLDKLVQGIMRSPQDEVSRQLVAAWALSSQRNDLARIWYWREFARMAQRPRWVELSLALEENDHPRIARLLEHDLERLAYRDAVEGAQRIGWSPLAESHAFERFQVNPNDHLLDRQIRALYNSHPGRLLYRNTLSEQGGIGFLEQQVLLTVPLSDRFAARVDAGNVNLRAQKSDALADYPASIRSVQGGLQMRHEIGTAEIMGGMREALSRHAMFSLLGNWKLDNRRSLNLGLRIGEPATESVALQIGGLKDELDLSLTNQLTPRDSLMLKVSGRALLDQERRSLGEGAAIEGELTHRLLFSWPDTSLRLFSGYHHYRQTGSPVDKTLAMIPATTTADASFFVPASFFQAGTGFSIGSEGRYNYIRDWRPFGAADLVWNSTSGIGYHYEFGLLGPVLGTDNLELAFGQDSGAFGRSDMTTRFDLRYCYYFK